MRLPFSHKGYTKLEMAVFPTVRRRDKYGDVGDTVSVEVGERGEREKWGEAEIVAKNEWLLGEIPDKFLLYDTESGIIGEARDSIQSFYRTPLEHDEPMTVYWLRWTDRDLSPGGGSR